jgi:addiction module RelE/StbE family toxin
MRELVSTPKFRRAFRRFARRNRLLQQRIENTLEMMEQDVFAATLSAHKLSGTLYGLWACSCGYDCRIVFAIEQDETSGDEVIVLLDIGTHDEVY